MVVGVLVGVAFLDPDPDPVVGLPLGPVTCTAFVPFGVGLVENSTVSPFFSEYGWGCRHDEMSLELT